MESSGKVERGTTSRVIRLGRRTLGLVRFPGSRRWAAASLINAVGTGLLLPLTVLFFTIHVGLSPASVGLGLTIGGLLALGCVPVGGILVDRYGAKRVLLACWALAAAGYVGYGSVTNWGEFLVAVTAVEIAGAAESTAGKTLVTELAGGEDRVRLLASQRSLGNIGFGVGGLLATAALAVGGAAYLFVVYADAASVVIAIALVSGLRIPRAPIAPDVRRARTGGLGVVFADRRYVTLAALDFLTTFQDGALLVALPLWVVLHTHAPRALTGVLFTLNTLLVVLFGVRASAGITTIADAPRTYRRAAVLMVLSAAAYLAAHYVDATAAVLLLVLGLLLHTATEISAAAGEWLASIELADPAHRGKYLSVYRLGYSLQDTVVPLAVTSLLALGTVWLWPALAALVATGALASAIVTARAASAPPPDAVTPERTHDSAPAARNEPIGEPRAGMTIGMDAS